MFKKISIYTISILLVTIMTACNNQNNNDEEKTLTICNNIEKDIKIYQNNELDKDELYSKLENYQSICTNETSNICITINAVISIPKEQEEVRELFIKDILNHCNKK